MSDATNILNAMAPGDANAAAELLPLVYDELRKLAAHKMAAEAPGQTLQPTALVHEAWLRFEAERQALALMDHPNIARIYDGGTTQTEVVEQASRLPTGRLAPEGRAAGETPAGTGGTPVPLSAGRPYFVMELVRGVPITKYCDENNFSVRERLQLFVQVCQAVQHAHQKGIIHRDLKPSNILITVNDGVPVPKMIDFGVAKATQQELTDNTIVTQFHHFIGTPAYMSPEQAAMTSLDIDTRSDIYALGVLLYELLTGKTPFNGKELLASGLDETRRIIREKEPLRPSTRLARQRGSAKSAIRNPQSGIDPDLDWIVMKCLEKDRTRRYETANGLAADIKRHLNDEPIVARPPSRLYEFQKTVRRICPQRHGAPGGGCPESRPANQSSFGTVAPGSRGAVFANPHAVVGQTGVESLPDREKKRRGKWAWLSRRFNARWKSSKP